MSEYSRFDLNNLANGIFYALKDREVQQINFTREQAEIALWALEAADKTLRALQQLAHPHEAGPPTGDGDGGEP